MGRQWLEKNKAITANKRAKITSKLVREITVAAKMGAADPSMNPRLQMSVDAARKQSVSSDVIARAIKKGSGEGNDTADYEMIVYEGMAASYYFIRHAYIFLNTYVLMYLPIHSSIYIFICLYIPIYLCIYVLTY